MMATTTRNLRRYDHRLREFVRSTGDIQHAIHRGVPRSTAHGWLKSPRTEVVTIDVTDMDHFRLQQELLALRRRVARLIALLRLLVVLSRLSGFSLTGTRIPDGTGKQMLMRAIQRSRAVLPLRVVLRILRLSQTRYHSWKREEDCCFDDMPSCPRSSSQQLTQAEVDTIKEMVTSEEYRHVPTGTLALLAQRLGKVFASSSTWYRLIRIHDWRRLRKRIHPAKHDLQLNRQCVRIDLAIGRFWSIYAPPREISRQTDEIVRESCQSRIFSTRTFLSQSPQP